MRLSRYAVSMLVCLTFAAQSRGWDPANGDWTKTDASDVRVMTWNVEDGIRSGIAKTEGFNQWTSLARIVAALKPDVLVLQECGDNGSVDSVANLELVVDRFLHGGSDPFLGGTVTAYVQAYDADYDLPHVFVSTLTDGFNRNVILSRFPFADLNGDTKSEYVDPPFLLPDAYQNGGSQSTIRGFQFVELDLPDATYAGDLVVGNAHLKAGGSASDFDDRERAGQMVAYFVDYWYNGAGTGIPDPNAKIIDSPAATDILDANTPVILGGDWNEDEASNGGRGPAAWLSEAQFPGTGDGTDRDRTDATFDDAVTFCQSDPDSQGNSKLDYVAWQDSIASELLSFIFNTSEITECAEYPPEFDGFTPSPSFMSNLASDHRPVVVDVELPLVGLLPGSCCTSGSCSEVTLTACFGQGGTYGGDGSTCADDADGDGVTDVCDVCPGFDDGLDPDGDGVPSGCDACPNDNPDDTDADGVCDSDDVCAGFDDAVDPDGDGVPSGCDPCPADNPDDSDADGVCDSDDVCPGFDDGLDADADDVPDGCDVCAGFDDAVDPDGDGVPDGCDPCPADNPDDTDTDGVCDSDDICPGFDDGLDADTDTVPDGCDVCPGFDDAVDPDGDGVPDGCDPCPADNPDDSDADSVCDSDDVCPGGDDTLDFDEDTVPDACDPCPMDPDPGCEPPSCLDAADCGDLDGNGIRDDACAWYACEAETCSAVAKVTQADIGGANGVCPVDGTCDGNDNFHALNCFANRDTFGNTGYPCENDSPSAVNVDAGGANGSCVLDGVCDGNDNFHALNCFANLDTLGDTPYPCDCAGPAPAGPGAGVRARPRPAAAVTLRAPATVRAGGLLYVDVILADDLAALRGYQLHLGIRSSGHGRGLPELVDIFIDAERQPWVFEAAGAWRAFNVEIAQMVAGVTAAAGVRARAGEHLATFVYRVPRKAAGTFVVDVRYDGGSREPSERTFLFGEYAAPIDVLEAGTATITVTPRRGRSKR